MSTGQKYSGKGGTATLPEQTAKKSPQTPFEPGSQRSINPRIYQAQTRLLSLVDQFSARGNYTPLQAAHDLLHHWLVTPALQLTDEDDKDQLHAVLLLIDSLSEVYPINGLSTFSGQGEVLEPLRMMDKFSSRLHPHFLNHLELTEEEEPYAGLLNVPDESMAPQLPKDSTAVVVAVDRSEYAPVAGVVIVLMDFAPKRPLLGRVAQNSGGSLLLVRDNPEFREERLLLSEVRFMGQVRYIINKQVV